MDHFLKEAPLPAAILACLCALAFLFSSGA